MNHNNLHSLFFLGFVLGACGYSAEGEWEAIEKHIVVDGRVAEKKSVPYEDCYASIEEEGEEELICVNRGFTFDVYNSDASKFEATNDITTGQEILTETKEYSQDQHTFTDRNNFEFTCLLSKNDGEKELYCDFTSSIGYLSDAKILFREKEDD